MIQDLTDRQQREREFYREYSERHKGDEVIFDPVLGEEQRPWNAYWHFYDIVVQHYVNAEQRLLDFGCGLGVASMCFAKIGYQVSGFDICEQNIHLCRTNAQKYGFQDRTEFSVRIAEDLEYRNDEFDVVAGMDILHHVEIAPAIREVHRVLRPGGIAVFHEFIEVPVFDAVRSSRFITRFISKDMSLELHRTHDERKLNKENLRAIRSVFRQCETYRFNLFDRFIRQWPGGPTQRARGVIERVDHQIFKILPFMKCFGGEVVLVLRK